MSTPSRPTAAGGGRLPGQGYYAGSCREIFGAAAPLQPVLAGVLPFDSPSSPPPHTTPLSASLPPLPLPVFRCQQPHCLHSQPWAPHTSQGGRRCVACALPALSRLLPLAPPHTRTPTPTAHPTATCSHTLPGCPVSHEAAQGAPAAARRGCWRLHQQWVRGLPLPPWRLRACCRCLTPTPSSTPPLTHTFTAHLSGVAAQQQQQQRAARRPTWAPSSPLSSSTLALRRRARQQRQPRLQRQQLLRVAVGAPLAQRGRGAAAAAAAAQQLAPEWAAPPPCQCPLSLAPGLAAQRWAGAVGLQLGGPAPP